MLHEELHSIEISLKVIITPQDIYVATGETPALSNAFYKWECLL